MFSSSDIPYEGVVIRPPSEADSLIFQITLGCSDNGCIFCPAYKEKQFSVKTFAAVDRELRDAARHAPETRKIFFADGDPLIVEQQQLAALLERACVYFPRLTRIGMYGSVKSLERKSAQDLRALKALKLGIVYLGFETGDSEVYRSIRKYGSPEGNVGACLKVKEAGIKTNVTVILGLGGREHSESHACHTAEILNAAQPHQIAALTLMIAPGTELYERERTGRFTPLNETGFLSELYTMVSRLDDFKCLFFSNHASNYYPISARFPHDKATVLHELEKVRGMLAQGKRSFLRPESSRGL